MTGLKSVLILPGVLILLASSILSLDSKSNSSTTQAELIEMIRGIDNMTKVNDMPYLMPHPASVLCILTETPDLSNNMQMPPPTPDSGIKEAISPHDGNYINVYVNDIGKETMTKVKYPIYPEGTIIIKEKFGHSNPAKSESSKIELYTIMIKRSKGYNPKCGDWEFAAISGDFATFESGKIAKCMSCHFLQPDYGFVFRDEYLSEKYKADLK